MDYETKYNLLETEYWELLDWLKIHAPLTLAAFKNRNLTDD